VDGIYIDITRQKNCKKMKLMTIVLQKKNFNISAGFFGFLYSDRVNYVGWDYVY
jgi:hypothetical protein